MQKKAILHMYTLTDLFITITPRHARWGERPMYSTITIHNIFLSPWLVVNRSQDWNIFKIYSSFVFIINMLQSGVCSILPEGVRKLWIISSTILYKLVSIILYLVTVEMSMDTQISHWFRITSLVFSLLTSCIASFVSGSRNFMNYELLYKKVKQRKDDALKRM